MRPAALLPVLLVLAACAEPAPQVEPHVPDAEAVSLFGTPLLRQPLPEEARLRLEADLADAEAALRADSASVDAIVWVGRRQAYLGRYRDAVATFTRGLELHPDEPHLLRHRGHRYITLRQFGEAIADLSRAAELTMDRPDEVEPDGQPNAAGIPTSTLQTNIWYHLGLAHYLLGRFDAAETAFRRCLELAGNDDMRVAATDWVYMALRRQGRHAEAAALASSIPADLELLENHAYHRRILFYRGLLPEDSLLVPRAADDSALAAATQGYGIGNWNLVEGDTLRAAELFRRVIETRSWAAFGYLASEADLVQLGDAAAVPVRNPPAPPR
jgi:tetratricopeptide (TPR) repeat protein